MASHIGKAARARRYSQLFSPGGGPLTAAQNAGDVLAANGIVMDAFYTDVRPDLADWRESRGLPRDPSAAYEASGYQQRIEDERVGGTQAGWGA